MSVVLSNEQVSFIREHVVSSLHKLGAEVFVFGSRATGKCSKFSDLDLLVRCSDNLSTIKKEISKISEFLEESSFPFKVDLVIESELAEADRESVLASALIFP